MQRQQKRQRKWRQKRQPYLQQPAEEKHYKMKLRILEGGCRRWGAAGDCSTCDSRCPSCRGVRRGGAGGGVAWHLRAQQLDNVWAGG
jgi:hypothetical protein